MKFAVIGCGSIGQRHIRNLLSLGINDIVIYDSNQRLLKEVAKKFKVRTLESLNFESILCTFVCTPPSTHVQIATKALRRKSHVFIEKPLSSSLNGVEQLEYIASKNRLQVFVGYAFRFDVGLRKVRELLSKNIIGNVLSYDAYEGWYLPKWRPWQDYKKSYTASRRLGGGIILDGSHEINYLQWLGGKIDQVFSYYRTVPHLKVETEGLAEILFRFKSKAIGRVHLDFVNPSYNRHCEIIGEKGSIKWSFEQKTIEIQKNSQTGGRRIKYGKDNNEMYLREVQHIIDCLNGNSDKTITLKDAKRTLEISLAIIRSGKTNRPIPV